MCSFHRSAKQDENTRYIDIGPVNKVGALFCRLLHSCVCMYVCVCCVVIQLCSESLSCVPLGDCSPPLHVPICCGARP